MHYGHWRVILCRSKLVARAFARSVGRTTLPLSDKVWQGLSQGLRELTFACITPAQTRLLQSVKDCSLPVLEREAKQASWPHEDAATCQAGTRIFL
jgi:hypothetical protein